jgi:hypothetical protein
MSSQASTTSLDIDRYDPLGRVLARLFGANIAFNVAAMVVLQWILALIELTVVRRNATYNVTFVDYLWLVVVVPFLWAYYTASRFRIPNLPRVIESNDVVEEEAKDEYKGLLDTFEEYVGSPWVPVTAILFSGVAIALLYSFFWEVKPPRFGRSTPTALWVAVWGLFTVYVVALTGIRELLALFWLNRFFHKVSIRIHALYPGGGGGLGFVGLHYRALIIFVIAIGYALTVWNFVVPLLENQPIDVGLETILVWAGYLLVVFTGLALPLWPAHTVMQRNKTELLLHISAQFDSVLENTRSFKDEEALSGEGGQAKAKELIERYELVERAVPTWPINVRVLRRFSITATLPIIIGIGSLVIDFYKTRQRGTAFRQARPSVQ